MTDRAIPCDPDSIYVLRQGRRVPEHLFIGDPDAPDDDDEPLATVPADIAAQMVEAMRLLAWVNLRPDVLTRYLADMEDDR